MSEHDGHRSRMIQKLDSDTLFDHEMLEVLLFAAVPRRNTNDLAHRLLAEFGCIENMFSASTEQLKRVDGVGDQVVAFLYTVGYFYKKMQDRKPQDFPKEYGSESFIPFVKREYAGSTREQLDVYLLDHESRVYMRHSFSGESICHVDLEPDELTKVIVDNRPAGIVLVHNHPFGEASASEADDKTTRQCQLVCSFHNVLLCDHIIYAPDGVYSYYLSGRMKLISEKYSVQTMLTKEER